MRMRMRTCMHVCMRMGTHMHKWIQVQRRHASRLDRGACACSGSGRVSMRAAPEALRAHRALTLGQRVKRLAGLALRGRIQVQGGREDIVVGGGWGFRWAWGILRAALG
jgi:hypothetical protein